jgi:DNA-directed RNA polymerase omega subunit
MIMVYQPVEELLPKAEGNVYTLSTIAFRRAHELANGSPKLVEAPASEKIATTTFREIREGKVVSTAYAEANAQDEKDRKKKK